MYDAQVFLRFENKYKNDKANNSNEKTAGQMEIENRNLKEEQKSNKGTKEIFN